MPAASRRTKTPAPTIYRKAATIIADECSYIYLYNPSVIQAWTKDMSGYEARRDKAIRFRDREHHAKAEHNDARCVTNPVVRFLARRLLYSLVVMLGVLVVVFALVHLVPGDPVRIALGTRYTPQAYDALRSASGLDRPIVEQFFGYIGLGAHRRPRRQLPQRRPGHGHPARAAARDRVARRWWASSSRC